MHTYIHRYTHTCVCKVFKATSRELRNHISFLKPFCTPVSGSFRVGNRNSLISYEKLVNVKQAYKTASNRCINEAVTGIKYLKLNAVQLYLDSTDYRTEKNCILLLGNSSPHFLFL